MQSRRLDITEYKRSQVLDVGEMMEIRKSKRKGNIRNNLGRRSGRERKRQAKTQEEWDREMGQRR